MLECLPTSQAHPVPSMQPNYQKVALFSNSINAVQGQCTPHKYKKPTKRETSCTRWRCQAQKYRERLPMVPYRVSQARRENPKGTLISLQHDQFPSRVFVEHSLGFAPVRRYSYHRSKHILRQASTYGPWLVSVVISLSKRSRKSAATLAVSYIC